MKTINDYKNLLSYKNLPHVFTDGHSHVSTGLQQEFPLCKSLSAETVIINEDLNDILYTMFLIAHML